MNECCNGLKQHFPEHCLSRKSTAEENGRKLTLSGSKNFCLLRVDGCWVDGSEQKKCDFIMFCCDSKRAFITEIKGKNIVKACEQIENTYRLLPKEVQTNYKLEGCIIASRVPKTDTRLARIKDRLKRELRLDIQQQSRQMTISVSQ